MGETTEVHDFSWALRQLKMGKKLCRHRWNGKKMFIYKQEGSIIPRSAARNEHLEKLGYDSFMINPHIDMKTADGSICIGWLASQTDMFALDWEIVED